MNEQEEISAETGTTGEHREARVTASPTKTPTVRSSAVPGSGKAHLAALRPTVCSVGAPILSPAGAIVVVEADDGDQLVWVGIDHPSGGRRISPGHITQSEFDAEFLPLAQKVGDGPGWRAELAYLAANCIKTVAKRKAAEAGFRDMDNESSCLLGGGGSFRDLLETVAAPALERFRVQG